LGSGDLAVGHDDLLGKLFPEWRGNFFIGGLSSKALVRLVMNGDRVAGEERLLTDRDARIREVVEGPDGALYLLTDSENGSLLKVTPRNKHSGKRTRCKQQAALSDFRASNGRLRSLANGSALMTAAAHARTNRAKAKKHHRPSAWLWYRCYCRSSNGEGSGTGGESARKIEGTKVESWTGCGTAK
jgi:hypothetical protein